MMFKSAFLKTAFVFSLYTSAALAFSSGVKAQEVAGDVSQGVANTEAAPAALDAEVYKNLEEAYQINLSLGRSDFRPNEYNSLFYTVWQHSLLQDAKRLFRTRKPGEYEVPVEQDPAKRERGIRELSLGGILFKAADNWIVWLNGKRITPDAIPKEVIDIRVDKEYVELKWLDQYNNLIYPVRIRPHQRFNLDTRIFLPGRSTL